LPREHGRVPARSWCRRLARDMVRGLVWSTGDVDVIRSANEHAAPDSRPATEQLDATGRDRNDLLAEWTRSGQLTYGDAELLIALDETTPWQA
jgi:hypothetical protein